MTTATALAPTDVLGRLQELLAALTQRAVSEERAMCLVDELLEHDGDALCDALLGGLKSMEAAAHAQVKAACLDAITDDSMDPLARCQTVQDAIDVLKLAIERSGDAS